ncbi:MAG TPA: hypothetical protein VMR34_00490 [Candidatus Saccharimonadales bacterium]|nr:hypothetical protein [Candidatus Saccharimonadales bacterium]
MANKFEIFSPPGGQEPSRFVDSDTVPLLQPLRSEARHYAAEKLDYNFQLLVEGRFEQVPLPMDVLGTAQRVVETRIIYGEFSPEHLEAKQGLLLDCERLFGEAFRKNTWEYFSEVEQILDPVSGDYFAHGFNLSAITEDGLSPVAEPEEQDRRSNEFVEEVTYKTIGHLGLSETVSVQTVSQCTDWAHAAFKRDKKASHGGYAPGINKLMGRGVRFIPGGNRFEEQIALSGTYITHEVVTATFADMGLLKDSEDIGKTGIQGKQIIDLEGGSVIDLAKALDKKASEFWGVPIFMGELLQEGQVADYDSIADQAEARRQKLVPKPLEMANYLVSLVENGTDRGAAEGLVNNYLKQVMLDVLKYHPEEAETMFDKETADGLAEVAWLRANGQELEAELMLIEVERNAPAPSFCGAGSCGLEAVNPISPDAILAKSLGLDGELLHDTERACKICSAKKVIYETKKGNKVCTGCHSKQIDGKISYGSGNQKNELKSQNLLVKARPAKG